MKELVFQVNFKSDIVLPASSNTEGNIEQLDFIPGSNFLGIVASQYPEFQKRGTNFDIFHSGKVRFGDATIISKDAKSTYKVPSSYFHEKLDDSKIFNHHHIDDFKKFTQLRQLKNGYVTEDKELIYIDYDYSQKSAYDRVNRKSKESSMYGYKAIKGGTKWQFTLNYDDSIINNDDIELIKITLKNSTRLGKSRSAQYGEIEITQVDVIKNISEQESEHIILYANSRLALVDECGNATYDLKYICSDLTDANINYEKTQIKTSTFTPYNGTRKTKDYERVCINKGSVIVLNISQEQLEKVKKEIKGGIGAYLSEGFGNILINPSFLMYKEVFNLKKDFENESDEVKPIENELAQFLYEKQEYKDKTLRLSNEVYKFIEKNKNLFKKKINSQWGAIRSFTIQAKDADELYNLLFDKNPEKNPRGFLMSKKANDKWDQKLVKKLKECKQMCEDKNIDYVKFMKLLAMKTPRVKELEEKGASDEN